MIEIVFWISIAFIFYAYLGYPLALQLLNMFRSYPVVKGDIEPQVSFIIAAHNEELRIGAKIDNTLAQAYPAGKLEIIIASDCSTDRTDEIVKSYASQGVRLIRASERKGKEAAQKLAVQEAKGGILVFSDVATILLESGVRNIVRNFSDLTVGCVSSVDRLVNQDGRIGGEGAYVKYEMFLRSLESRVNSLVGLSGSFFAARTEVCQNWPVNLQSDFNTLLNSIRMGLRGVSDPESVGYYKNISDERREFERKVRTVLRGISVFMSSLFILNPVKYGLISWQLFSHKLCRWLVPFAMIIVFVSNLGLLAASQLYVLTFLLQLVLYALAIIGCTSLGHYGRSALKIPAFFVIVNVSILSAWFRYLRGERMVSWKPSER